MAAPLSSVTFSSTPRSWARYPLTVSTRFGIRSWRRLSWVSMSAHASPDLTRSETRLL